MITPALPRLLFIITFFAVVQELISQSTISGEVFNRDGEPLIGVNISIKNGESGTITGLDGTYQIEAQRGDTLVFSYIGYQSVEAMVSELKRVDILLHPLISLLDQIVVIGYGVQKKKDITGATTSLQSEAFNQGVVNSPEQLIQGKLAGVELVSNSGAPGDAFSIRIRGAGTIRAGNDPLYVIDGYPLDITTTTPGNAASATPLQIGLQGSNPLSFLNPEDIASIHVLKDASAGAIYGARAANGVVLIETKSGRAGRTKLRYAAYADVAQLRKKLDVLSAEEWRAGQRDNGFNGNDFGASTDWQEETFRTAFTHNHELSLEGGSEQTTYRTSFQYLDQEGIANGNDWTRWSGRAKIRHRALRDRLTLTGNLSLARVRDKPSMGGGAATNPTFPVFNPDGSLFQPSPIMQTPVAVQRLKSDLITTSRMLGNLTAALTILDGLEYKVNTGGDHTLATRRSNEAISLTVQENGKATLSEREANSWLIEHYLTYTGNWPGHQLTALGGYSFQEFTSKDFLLSRGGFVSDEILNVNNIGSGALVIIDESGVEKSALQSFFGRVHYQFRDRYLLTANVRADGSTRFGDNNRYGFFPSLALAWRLSEEGFVKEVDFIDQLKLRASWGITGNQEIPNKITQFVLGTPPFSGYVLDGSNPTNGYTFVRTPNEDLQWEETRQLNAGIDFSFRGGRLNGSIDYFDKRTTKLLVQVLTASAPTTTAWTNLDAEVVNNGLEIALSAAILHKNNFKWESSLAFTKVNNEVRGLPTDLFVSQNQIITNGEPLGAFWGRQWIGFDEQGVDEFLKNADGSEVFKVIGYGLPDFTWGLTNQFNIGPFDLSFLLQGVHGNDVNNREPSKSKVGFAFGENVPREVLDTEESFGNTVRFSSRFLEDGSYARLSYLTLGYQFPAGAVDWLDAFRLYLTGTNLLLLTDYTGYDPEVNIVTSQTDRFGRSAGIPPIGIGGGYPRARSFQLGLQITFL